MCAGLWCLVEGDASCKTKLDPPLDGTECGADKVTPAAWALGSQEAVRTVPRAPGESPGPPSSACGAHSGQTATHMISLFLL